MLLCIMMLMIGISVSAQVTTSSISGIVLDENEAPLVGAVVKAKHIPSGTVYGAKANLDGRFDMQGMRPGGPYTVEVSFIGYSTHVINDITLQLGETYDLTVNMQPSNYQLGEIVVSAVKTKFGANKTGASTNISMSQIASMPTVNRSIADVTRLSPYAGSGMGFAGSDGRSTNFTVDGANFNNNFGLSDKLPGGGTPISLEAIEEMQVVIAPFDLRQTNFVGGGVNAVTKSGTNTFKGSAYTYHYNEDTFEV